MSTDPRYRTKLYLDTYLTAANITKDDDATEAPVITQFERPPYPLKFIYFWPKYRDGVYTILTPTTTPILDYTEVIYGYKESVPIEISCVSRPGTITGDLLRYKMEEELRNVVETYPRGSRRSLTRLHQTVRDQGNFKLHTVTYNLNYKRIAENYAPSKPAFNYDLAFTYEGDRLTGGTEGNWDITNHKGGSTVAITINNENNIYLNLTAYVGDAYVHNETNLGISTTTQPKLLVRYKTSANATARVDTDDETVMSERSSSTFKTEEFDLTTGETLDEIRLYACDGIGTVTYDFVQIYTGNYIIPVVTQMRQPGISKDVMLSIPSMSGNLTQAMGLGLMEVNMTCDLDIEPEALTWKRPQTTTPKTDNTAAQILYETQQECGSDTQYPWVWLNLGDPPIQMKARLVEVHPSFTGEAGMLDLLWREYRHGSAANETAVERYGLSL